jgi:hypothetical protein
MKRIGILTEDYDNDGKGYRDLLKKKFGEKAFFLPILPLERGKQLDNRKKMAGLIEKAFTQNKLDFILYIRDLDALPSDERAKATLQDWFSFAENTAKGISFMVIYESEALILADFDTFCKIKKIKAQYKKDPMYREDPKGYLGKYGYNEKELPKIFAQLDFDTILKKHNGFAHFVDALKSQITPPRKAKKK